MSHSTVLVIGPDPEVQLEPFNEELSVEPYWTTEALNVTDFWPVKGWIEEGKLPANATMQQAVDVYAAEYGEDSDDKFRITDEGVLERESTYNPKSRWDWYVLGGRWRGYFHMKLPTPMLDTFTPVVGESGAFGNNVNADCDQLLKCQIDWDAARDEAAREAAKTFDKLHQATKDLGVPPETWKQCVARNLGELDALEYSNLDDGQRAEYDRRIGVARVEHHEHPWTIAIRQSGHERFFGDAIEDYHLADPDGRQKCIDEAIAGVYIPFAILYNGEWIERGKMGWFGMASGEMDEALWTQRAAKLIEDLPDDTLLSLYDVHI